MLKVKAFSNVPEDLIEFSVNRWLEEIYEKVGFIDIVSASQSQDGEYVALTISSFLTSYISKRH